MHSLKKRTKARAKQSMYLLLIMLCLNTTSTYVWAQNTVAGADISLSGAQQQFDELDNAENVTLAFVPYLQSNNWALSLDLRWEQINGEYFVNNRKGNILTVCEKLNTVSSAQLARFLERRPRASTLVERCNNLNASTSENTSGIADISFYGSYSRPLEPANLWYLMLTGGATWDNADWEDGLGSGTQDMFIETALNADNGKGFATATLGYNVVFGGDLEEFYDNYLYGYVELGWHITERLQLSSLINWSEASSDIDDDVTSLSLKLHAVISRSFSAGLTYTEFLNMEDYPNNELRGRVTFHF